MNLTEQQLTRTLTSHADDAPTPDGLLSAVHARSRRRHRRRAAAGALTVAASLAVGATALQVTALPDRRGEAVLAWQDAAASTFLTPVDLRPTFPLTPGYLPPDVQTVPRLSLERGITSAEWENRSNGADGPLSGITATVFPTAPEADERATSEPVDINGASGSLVRYPGASTVVVWQRGPQQWVYVQGVAPVSEQETLAFARSLQEQPVQQPSSFQIDLVPDGFVLAELRPTGLTLGPAGGLLNPQDDPRAVVVSVRRASESTDGRGAPVRVGQRSGWLAQESGRFQLVLRLDADRRLEISTPSTGQWDRTELARFADGITYTGPMPRREG